MKRSHGSVAPIPLDDAGLHRPRQGFVNLQPGAPRTRKPLEIKNAVAGKSAELYIYDEIGFDWWTGGGVTAKSIMEALDEIGDVEQIDLHVNSPGGDIFEGVAIYNALVRNKARLVVYVDALAASAASFIAQAGDEIIMMTASTMMIHDGWGFVMGNADEMRAQADVLDKLSNNIASIYAERTGEPTEEWRAVMKAEAWYTAEEAVSAGLADRVDTKGARAENRWDLSVFNFAGREAAPSPEFIRQSALLNRVKENPVGNPKMHTEGGDETQPTVVPDEPVTSTDTDETVEVVPVVVDPEANPGQREVEPLPQQPVIPADKAGTTAQNAPRLTVLVNGVATSDPNAVQAHINMLEGFAKESKESGRKNFVQSLVDNGQLAAPMGEGTKNLVLNMTDQQYEDFRNLYANAPQLPLLARHGVQASTEQTADKARADRIEVLQGIVKHHRDSGMKESELQAKDSYIELQGLLAAVAGQGS